MSKASRHWFEEAFNDALDGRATQWIADLRQDGAPVSEMVEGLLRTAFATGYAAGIADQHKILRTVGARQQARQEGGE